MGSKFLTWEEKEIYKFAIFQEELDRLREKEGKKKIRKPNHKLQSTIQFQY